jgi:hypothetical protein
MAYTFGEKTKSTARLSQDSSPSSTFPSHNNQTSFAQPGISATSQLQASIPQSRNFAMSGPNMEALIAQAFVKPIEAAVQKVYYDNPVSRF